MDLGLDFAEIVDHGGAGFIRIVCVEEFLVDDVGEVHVQMYGVVEGKAKDHSYKLEADGGFEGLPVEPVKPAVVFWEEHVKMRVEQ